jgi:hypothetical protein
MVTRSNYPANMVVEANLSSGNANAIPEIIMRGNISANTGIKARVDCRSVDVGGTGSYLNAPFSGWNVVSAPNNFSFPSNGTFQKLTFSGTGNNFAFSYNNTPTSTLTNSASDLNNASGVIGFANHNGTPVSLQWIRAYPSTANTVSVSITNTGATFTRTITNNSIGSSTLNLGQDFGTNSSPLGTFLQYNHSGSASSAHWFIPWTNLWKEYRGNTTGFTTTPASSFTLTSTGYTNGVTTSISSGVTTPIIIALKRGSQFFDMGTFVGNGSLNRTIGHSLNVFPGLVIVFANSRQPVGIWFNRATGNADVFNALNGFNDAILGETAATSTNQTLGNWLTNTTFTLPSEGNLSSVTYYWFAFANSGPNIQIGTYNTSSSYTVTTNFRPGFLLTEGSSGGCYNWFNPHNLADNTLTNSANVNINTSSFGSQGFAMNFSSTGFTVPNTPNSWYSNGAGNVYYMAIKSSS